MLETATSVLDGDRKWVKNLAERRLDIIRMAQDGEDAYTKNDFEWNWNEDAKQFLIDSGIDSDVVEDYPIQNIKTYD